MSRLSMTAKRAAATVAIALLGVSTAVAGGLTINLVQETGSLESEHVIMAGSVVKDDAPTGNVAVCLAEWRLAPKPALVAGPTLVAFVEGGPKGVLSMASRDQLCQGSDCRSLAISVLDHNFQLEGSPSGAVCEDPYGIAQRYGVTRVELADLEATDTASATVNVSTLTTNGRMLMEFGAQFRETCVIPADDNDVRYGQGHVWDGSPAHGFLPVSSLYVCSEGVRVCTFSRSFMEDSLSQVELRGNDLDNTIMPSALGSPDGERTCGVGTDGGAFEFYKVYGWPASFKAHMRLLGRGGHDWLVGGPNSDTIYGGTGDDMLRGAGGSGNRLFGETGHDIMHDAAGGLCDGGSPEPDSDCFSDPWVWPPAPYPAGDCCCHSCPNHRGCFYADATPGGPETAPDPW